MRNKQEKHLQNLLTEIKSLTETKYRRGQEEHGGDLFDMPTKELLDNAIDEAIDQLVYLLTLKEKMK